jgi:hypothetical protein
MIPDFSLGHNRLICSTSKIKGSSLGFSGKSLLFYLPETLLNQNLDVYSRLDGIIYEPEEMIANKKRDDRKRPSLNW